MLAQPADHQRGAADGGAGQRAQQHFAAAFRPPVPVDRVRRALFNAPVIIHRIVRSRQQRGRAGDVDASALPARSSAE